MDESANPIHPTSIGALLAEEWTIQPYSTLPSFLERVMMDEAAKATQDAIYTGIELLVRRLQQLSAYEERRVSLQRARAWIAALVLLQRATRVAAAAMARVVHSCKQELQALLIFFVELFFLKANDATLSQTIYGSKCVRLQASAPDQQQQQRRRKLSPLVDTDRTRLALIMALMPYINKKIQVLFRKWEIQHDITSRMDEEESTARQWTRRLLQLRVPWMMATAATKVMFQWRYLLGQSFEYDVWSELLGQLVRRVTKADSISGTNSSKSVDDTKNSRDATTTASDISTVRRSILYLVSASIAFGWMTQLRAAWDTHQRVARRSSAAFPPPPPPPTNLNDTTTTNIPSECCPICHGPRVEPAASISGYVFCESCLLSYIQRRAMCPVTGIPCTESSVVKLYEPRNMGQQPE
jgi:peroxin-12